MSAWDPLITTLPGQHVGAAAYGTVVARLLALLHMDAPACSTGVLRSTNWWYTAAAVACMHSIAHAVSRGRYVRPVLAAVWLAAQVHRHTHCVHTRVLLLALVCTAAVTLSGMACRVDAHAVLVHVLVLLRLRLALLGSGSVRSRVYDRHCHRAVARAPCRQRRGECSRPLLSSPQLRHRRQRGPVHVRSLAFSAAPSRFSFGRQTWCG
jgi:hypothetical protein